MQNRNFASTAVGFDTPPINRAEAILSRVIGHLSKKRD
jgi:hypothetical protein